MFLALYEYFQTGRKIQFEEIEMKMMLSVMISRLDKDKKYYERTVEKRREAGRTGGLASGKARRALKRELEELQEANVQIVNDGQRFKADKEKEEDNDNEQEREEENKNYYYYYSGRSEDTIPDAQGEFICYGREQYPTTRTEVEKVCILADELMHTYRNKKASSHDCEKVFEYVHTLAVNEYGEHYGIYSPQKEELLRHVFEEAAARSDLNWQYINRIYLNYEKNRVRNLEEALEYEGKWQRGEIT